MPETPHTPISQRGESPTTPPFAQAGKQSLGRQHIRRGLFFLSIVTAGCTLVAYLWPVDRTELIAIFAADKKAGYINTSGRVVISPDWRRLDHFDEMGMARASRDGNDMGWIDRRGKVVIPMEWSQADRFDAEGLARVFKGKHCGWIDRKGKVVIPPQWEVTAPSFDSHGMARVMNDSKVGWINRMGEVVIPLEWDRSDSFDSAGMAAVRKGQKWGWINREGSIVIPISATLDQSEEPDGFPYIPYRHQEPDHTFPPDNPLRQFDSGGLVLIKGTGGFGWMNREGEIVINPIWGVTYPFDSAGMALTQYNRKWGWIDRNGLPAIIPEWDEAFPFDAEGMACVRKKQKWGWINRKGEVVIELEWDGVRSSVEPTQANQFPESGQQEAHRNAPFLFDSGDMAMVRRGNFWGWINRNGIVTIEPAWEGSGKFDSSGMAPVKKNDYWGWVDRSGEIVIGPQWENPPTWIQSLELNWPQSVPLEFDSHDMLLVEKSGNLGWINRNGDLVIPTSYQNASEFDENGLAFVYGLAMGSRMNGHISNSPLREFQMESVGQWIDRSGKVVIPSPGSNWYWNTRLYRLVDQRHGLDKKLLPTNGYVAITPDAKPLWFKALLNRILSLVDKEPTKTDEPNFACMVFDVRGHKIWDSRRISFEAKCLALFGICLIAAFLTRPRNSGFKT